MLNRVADYDDFAWFYNRYWSEEFHRYAFPILERIWLGRVPHNGNILDVCCGTGYLADLLTARGFRVSGFDASPEMIRYARENAPLAEFEVSDAASFHNPLRFDAAVSTFDSLNHLLELDELEKAFRNIAAVLKSHAPFAFDMLLEEAYQTHWGEDFALVRKDHVLAITGSRYDRRNSIASCHVTMFRLRAGRWQRSDTVIRERCYSLDEIGYVIDNSGFVGVECYAARDLGMAGDLGQGRTFFVAHTDG
jgi:SAM-dependent methyltransferase